MKTNPEPDREDGLLDSILRDENWQAADADLKSRALGAFRAHHRARRVTRWAGCIAALALVIAGGAHWIGRPAPVPRQLAAMPRMSPPPSPAEPEKLRYLTDAELVAAFPPGSCFVAEVDGEKKLIFYDQEVEHQFVAGTGR